MGTDDCRAERGRAALSDAADIVDARERRRTPVTDRATSEPPWITVARPRSAAMWLSTSARYRIPTGKKAHESSDELESAEDDDDPSRISVAGDGRVLGRRSAGLGHILRSAFRARRFDGEVAMSRPTPEAEQLTAHGNAMYQRGKYGAAIDAYTAAITLVTRSCSAPGRRRRGYRKRKNWAAVKEDCVKALVRPGERCEFTSATWDIAERRFTEVRFAQSCPLARPAPARPRAAAPRVPTRTTLPTRPDRTETTAREVLPRPRATLTRAAIVTLPRLVAGCRSTEQGVENARASEATRMRSVGRELARAVPRVDDRIRRLDRAAGSTPSRPN